MNMMITKKKTNTTHLDWSEKIYFFSKMTLVLAKIQQIFNNYENILKFNLRNLEICVWLCIWNNIKYISQI